MLAINGTNIETVRIAVDDIEVADGQPRKDFDEAKIKRLSQSMSEFDLLQPVGVRASTGSRNWELCFGERRLRAAKLLGWRTIPARVLDLNDTEALKVIGIENLNRENLNLIEMAGYFEMLSKAAGMTNKQIGKAFGHDESWCKRLRRLLKLPPHIQQRLISGEMCPSSCRYILRFTGRPHVFAAIDDDIRSNPNAWRSLEACQARADQIADCFDKLETAAAGTAGSPAAAGDRQRGPETPARDWTKFKPYLPIIEPLRKDREALLILQELVEVLLADLKQPTASGEWILERLA